MASSLDESFGQSRLWQFTFDVRSRFDGKCDWIDVDVLWSMVIAYMQLLASWSDGSEQGPFDLKEISRIEDAKTRSMLREPVCESY